jgi:hypothetical protein
MPRKLAAVVSNVRMLLITYNWKQRIRCSGTLSCGAGAALLLYYCCRYSGASKNRPTIFELSGGSIEKDKVKNEWNNYESSYGKEAGEGIKDRWVILSKGSALAAM